MFWSRKQAFICLCCYVKVARCHLFWPLQAVLGISVGVPASSLCFEGLPVYGMERAQASSTTQSLPRRKPFASQPRSPAEASKQASSSAQSSAQQEANATEAKIYTGKLGTESLKCLNTASSTHWVGTRASPSLGTAYRVHLQINGRLKLQGHDTYSSMSMPVSPLAFAALFSGVKLSNTQRLLLKVGSSSLLEAPKHTCQLSDNPSHAVQEASW